MVAAQVCNHFSEVHALLFNIIYIQPYLNIPFIYDMKIRTYVRTHMGGPNIKRVIVNSVGFLVICLTILVKYFSDLN